MVITISRQYGSGGHQIGQLLAERFKLRFLDREIVEAVAQRLEVPVDWVEEKDEALDSWRERVRNFMAMSLPDAPVYQPLPVTGLEPLTGEMTVRLVREAIQQAARNGNVVIVGRGAQVLLAGHPGAVHIFVYAPRDTRIASIMERRALDREAAARLVDDIDQKRADYLRVMYNQDWRQPELYNLMLDTSLTGISGAVDLIEWWMTRFAARQVA